MTRPPIAKPPLGEAEALLKVPKDAHLATPQWNLRRDPNGELLTAHLQLTVTAGQVKLEMKAHWKSPESQQVRLQIPGSSWNVCRLCLTKGHDDVHWHCLDGYDTSIRRISPADIEREPYAIHQMLDRFVSALNITGFTQPMDNWS